MNRLLLKDGERAIFTLKSGSDLKSLGLFVFITVSIPNPSAGFFWTPGYNLKMPH